MKFLSLLKTAYSLGLANVFRVVYYRLQLKYGFHPVQFIKSEIPKEPFFSGNKILGKTKNSPRKDCQNNKINYFGYNIPLNVKGDTPPDWFSSPMGVGKADEKKPWWEIPDFDPSVGDIKKIWELSRMDWAIPMGQRIACGQKGDLIKLNVWLQDWVIKNPPYKGVNWKCGQEASIRVLHLALVAMMLNEVASTQSGLLNLIKEHLKRILPTISYAIGQANNHATSEAAALFVGGSWLEKNGDHSGAKFTKVGLNLLENRAKILFGNDGSFSQYSVNYHRLVLDTYSFCEIWRKKYTNQKFSEHLKRKMTLACKWLGQMVNFGNGNVPNLGSNDGAYILKLTNLDYFDFRPSIQLASGLFQKKTLLPKGPWNEQLKWMELKIPDNNVSGLKSMSFRDGGLHVLREQNMTAYLRFPRFKFRPPQADALHCDFWISGTNIFKDRGSYSYNSEEVSVEDFTGTKAHNTIEFDDRDQMRKISRFLYSDWLYSNDFKEVSKTSHGMEAEAAYVDYEKCFHKRKLVLNKKKFVVEDIIRGFKKKAILRWNLPNRNWVMDGDVITDGKIIIKITSNAPFKRKEIYNSLESIYYLKTQPITVIEYEVSESCQIFTEVYCP